MRQIRQWLERAGRGGAMPGKSIVLMLALATLLALPVARGQQTDTRPPLRVTVQTVVVPVTVKDDRGNLVTDLHRGEFRVLEDGVEQPISVFTTDPFPLSAVVVMDNSLTEKTAKEFQKSLLAIAAGFGANDEVALLTFDEFPHTVLELTADNDKVFTQLKRLRLSSHFPGVGSAVMTKGPRINAQPVGPGVPSPGARSDRGTKNIDDAVYAAAGMLRNLPRARRKIILLISDGNNSRRNTMSFKDTLRLLLSADVSVYAIDVGPKLLSPETSVLARYARLTGGDIFRANKDSQLEPLYSRITEQARNQYTLAYVPQDTDRTREYHSIEVRVGRPNLTLLARDGYFSGGVQ